MSIKERKSNTYNKAVRCFETYKKFAIVLMDNITSNQLKEMKRAWGPNTDFLIGKNSSVKRALKDSNKEEYSKVLDKVKGNISIVFYNNNIKDIKQVIDEYERESVAKVGDTAQTDVWIKAHITGMTSDKTGYFQTLGIPTKITKGKIEIMQDFKVLNTGDKVGPSQANLLSLVNIKPFRYKMGIVSVYEDNEFYDPSLIDIKDSDIENMFKTAILDVATFSIGSNTITEASVPYDINRAFHDVLKFGYGLGIPIADSPYNG